MESVLVIGLHEEPTRIPASLLGYVRAENREIAGRAISRKTCSP